MRRIDTVNTIDLAPGKKGFRGKNTAPGVPGTPILDTWLNDIQEEISNVIEGFGLPLGPARDQLFTVLRQRMTFVPVLSVTSAIPGAPVAGDMHLVAAVPAPAGAWAGQAGRIAIYNGTAWAFMTLPIGARVIDCATPVTSAARELRQQTALVWTPVEATTTNFGHVRRATAAEAKAGGDVAAFMGPAEVAALEAPNLVGDVTLYAYNGIYVIIPWATSRTNFLDPATTYAGGVFTPGPKDLGLWDISAWVNSSAGDTSLLRLYYQTGASVFDAVGENAGVWSGGKNLAMSFTTRLTAGMAFGTYVIPQTTSGNPTWITGKIRMTRLSS